MSEDALEQLSTKPFAYEVSDLRALNLQVVQWWVLLPSAAIFGFLIWFFGRIMLEEGFDWMLFGILVLIILAASGPWTWRPFLTHRTLRRQGLLQPMRIGIAPEQLTVDSARGDARIKWSAIRKIKLEGDRLFLFSSSAVAHIVPRRAFENDAEFEAFVAAAQDRWKQHHLF